MYAGKSDMRTRVVSNIGAIAAADVDVCVFGMFGDIFSRLRFAIFE
jgi:hypothetical protein